MPPFSRYPAPQWDIGQSGIFYGDIRAEVVNDLVPPVVVEMIGALQELLTVHGEFQAALIAQYRLYSLMDLSIA